MFKTAYLLIVTNRKQVALTSSMTPSKVIKPNSMEEKQPSIDITTTSSGVLTQEMFKTKEGKNKQPTRNTISR